MERRARASESTGAAMRGDALRSRRYSLNSRSRNPVTRKRTKLSLPEPRRCARSNRERVNCYACDVFTAMLFASRSDNSLRAERERSDAPREVPNSLVRDFFGATRCATQAVIRLPAIEVEYHIGRPKRATAERCCMTQLQASAPHPARNVADPVRKLESVAWWDVLLALRRILPRAARD